MYELRSFKRLPIHCAGVNVLFTDLSKQSSMPAGSRKFDFMLLDNCLIWFHNYLFTKCFEFLKAINLYYLRASLIIMVVILQFCFRIEKIFTSNMNWMYLTFQMEAVKFPDYGLAISMSNLRQLATFWH